MTAAQVTVVAMAPPPGPWTSWDSTGDACAWGYAKRQAKSIAARPKAGRGRPEEDVAQSTFPSTVAEIFHNRHNIKWWKNHFDEAQADGDDKGFDDEEKNGVKAILIGKDEIWNEDWRAETQYVYEVDVARRRIRFLGTFTKADAKMITMSDGRVVGLVLRSQLH